MATDCTVGSLHFCRLRIARLDANGRTPAGANNSIVTSHLGRLTARAVKRAGDDFEVVTGCGGVDWAYKGIDSLKRYDVLVDFTTLDPTVHELLAAWTLILSGGNNIGASTPAVGTSGLLRYYGVSLEAWTEARSGGGQPALLPYWRFVFPRVRLQADDRVLENGPMAAAFSGPALENPNFGNGPANDIPAGAFASINRVMTYFRDSAMPLPRCGYTTVAAQPSQLMAEAGDIFVARTAIGLPGHGLSAGTQVTVRAVHPAGTPGVGDTDDGGDVAVVEWGEPALVIGNDGQATVGTVRRAMSVPVAQLAVDFEAVQVAGEFSRAGAKKALDAVSGRATQTARTTYLALCSTAPLDNRLGTELTTAGYARQAVTWSAPSLADPPETHNTAVITFGPFIGDPPNVIHCMLMDLLVGGTAANMLMWWRLLRLRDADIGESIQVAAAGVSMTCT